MKSNPIGIVYRKELRDLLRDRRTIMSMIIVPVAIMPLVMAFFGLTATKLVGNVMKETPKVMILGGTNSPKTLAALQALKTIRLVPPSADYTNQISDKKIPVAVEIPPGFDAAISNALPASIRIYNYEGELKSTTAARTVEQFFRKQREQIISARMAERHVPEQLLNPFDIRQTNVAPPQKVTGNLLGMIIPYIVLLMCLTGAIYPAVDLTAGEKERGTMETLLCSPVARTRLVLGKCLVVFTASISTAFLSIFSNGVSFCVFKHYAPLDVRGGLAGITLDPVSLAAVFGMALPVGVFFAASLVTIGLFARSAKEANSYMQPLIMLCVIPAIACMLPGIELDWHLALIPVLNASLVCKEIVSGSIHWNLIAIVFGSMCAYAAVAVSAAVILFNRESVLFRT